MILGNDSHIPVLDVTVTVIEINLRTSSVDIIVSAIRYTFPDGYVP